MNFITKLSLSMNSITKKNYDAILIMIDRLIKYSHIAFFKKKYIAEQLEDIVLNKLIKYHEFVTISRRRFSIVAFLQKYGQNRRKFQIFRIKEFH